MSAPTRPHADPSAAEQPGATEAAEAHQPIVLLGPQGKQPNLAAELARLAEQGAVAAITAGWQEREGEDDELAGHLGRPLLNLRLHRRAEELFAEDRELFRAWRRRQEELRQVQENYRYRLDYALEPVRELSRRVAKAKAEGEGEVSPALTQARASAMDSLRQMDAEHLERVAEAHRNFEHSMDLDQRPSLEEHRQQIAELVQGAAAVLIAGGHVAGLLNRLRLFGLATQLRRRPVMAWSAGAMALSQRILLFHDSPPQGAGNAEFFAYGLGLFPGLVALPHAERRLQLHDPLRVGVLAQRLAPDMAVALDEGTVLSRTEGRWVARERVRRLGEQGSLVDLDGNPLQDSNPMEAES